VKLAGTNRTRDGVKLSAQNYATLSRPARTNAEEQSINRALIAVPSNPPEFDESASPFFARDNGATRLADDEVAALDAMIDKRGLADVLKSIEGLLESRIEDGVIQGGTVLLHLSRHDAWARAAERLRDLAFHPDIATL